MKAYKYLILTTGAMLSLACSSKTGSYSSDSCLKDRYADSFRIGAAVNHLVTNGRCQKSENILLTHFNSITAENSMKPDIIHPRPDVWNFDRSDEFVDFAQRNGLYTVGHGLVWYKQTPEFFWKDDSGRFRSREELAENMRSYIRKVTERYSGRISEWDVVMDAIEEDGSYRNKGWGEAYGDGYEAIRDAFTFAAEYAPDAQLNYVDANVWRPSHLQGIISMARRLQADGVRIDRIVMKGHWGLNYPDLTLVESAIDQLSSMGLRVAVGELEVDVLPISREGLVTSNAFAEQQFQYEEFEEFLDPYKEGLPADVAEQLDRRYEEIFRMFYRHRDQIDRVTFWGISDDQSWKNDTPVPNRTNYPLLFNRDKSAKPALYSIMDIPED